MEKIEKEIKPKQIKVQQQQQQEGGGSSFITLDAINIEALKRNNNANMEQQLQGPQSTSTSPRLRRALTKPSRSNCLCSPTTHVGSFRCRFHRTPGGMLRGHSVGSNLSEFTASKSHF